MFGPVDADSVREYVAMTHATAVGFGAAGDPAWLESTCTQGNQIIASMWYGRRRP